MGNTESQFNEGQEAVLSFLGIDRKQDPPAEEIPAVRPAQPPPVPAVPVVPPVASPVVPPPPKKAQAPPEQRPLPRGDDIETWSVSQLCNFIEYHCRSHYGSQFQALDEVLGNFRKHLVDGATVLHLNQQEWETLCPYIGPRVWIRMRVQQELTTTETLTGMSPSVKSFPQRNAGAEPPNAGAQPMSAAVVDSSRRLSRGSVPSSCPHDGHNPRQESHPGNRVLQAHRPSPPQSQCSVPSKAHLLPAEQSKKEQTAGLAGVISQNTMVPQKTSGGQPPAKQSQVSPDSSASKQSRVAADIKQSVESQNSSSRTKVSKQRQEGILTGDKLASLSKVQDKCRAWSAVLPEPSVDETLESVAESELSWENLAGITAATAVPCWRASDKRNPQFIL